MADNSINASDLFFKSYPYELKRLQLALDDVDIATWQARKAFQALRDLFEKIKSE